MKKATMALIIAITGILIMQTVMIILLFRQGQVISAKLDDLKSGISSAVRVRDDRKETPVYPDLSSWKKTVLFDMNKPGQFVNHDAAIDGGVFIFRGGNWLEPSRAIDLSGDFRVSLDYVLFPKDSPNGNAEWAFISKRDPDDDGAGLWFGIARNGGSYYLHVKRDNWAIFPRNAASEWNHVELIYHDGRFYVTENSRLLSRSEGMGDICIYRAKKDAPLLIGRDSILKTQDFTGKMKNLKIENLYK